MIDLNDVLLAMSNIPVDDPIAEIWGRQLQGGYKIIEYTGSLPIAINANGDALLDYRIYGTDGGVGVATENLVDFEAWLVREDVPYTKDGNGYTITGSLNKLYSNPYYFSDTDIYVSINGVMTIPIGSNIRIYIIKRDGTISGSVALGGNSNIRLTQNVLGAGIKFDYASVGPCTVDNLMLNLGRTALPYIPYGYKLPMTVGDGNTTQTVPVYIGENQLMENEYVSYTEQKIYRKNPANFFDGYFEPGAIDYNNGEEKPSATSIRTDFIELEPSNRFCIKWSTGNLYILPVSYDENKNFVKYLGAKANNPSYFDLSTNEKYIRFYLYNTITPPEEMMICKNADAPYYDPQDPPVPLPEIPTIDGTTIIDYDGTPKPSQMYVKYKDKG